jgi:polyketide cyclase/dehydrase/lipid transport protein
MARTARAATVVPLAPEGALALWTDLDRWPSFVEGFARTLEASGDWPSEGARVVWESGPGGRGRVTEKVLQHGTGRFATRISEDALQGRQSVSVTEDADGTRVELSLEYELTKYGPLRALADVIFIRRALRDALRRTLRRYAVEAEEDAGVR